MTRRLTSLHLLTGFFVIGLFGFAGCAASSPEVEPESPPPSRAGAMTAVRMELLFADLVPAIDGPSGAIRTRIDGFNVFLISDPTNDRMRIVVPVRLVEGLDRRILKVLLEANFYGTLDARYALSEGAIYATFLHPISSLTPELIESALSQVVSLAKTFGTSFSSGEFRLRGSIHGAR